MNNTQPAPLTAWREEVVYNKSTTTVTLGVNINHYIEHMFIQWFSNGYFIKKGPLTKLTIQNLIPSSSGFVYETQLRVRIICNNPYPYTGFMVTNIAVIGADAQKLQYSETPLTEFTAESSSLPATPHTTTLTCTATGGYPSVDSITLYKNNELIMRTSSDTLQYTSSQYGRYECVIDKKIDNVRKYLLLQEEASLNIMLQVDDCSVWTNSVSKVEESLSKLFTGITSGKITFRNSSLSCSSFLTFKSTLIYSSDDGAVTASDLINYLKSRVATDTTTALTVDGMELTVLQVGEDQSNPPVVLIGLFFGGIGASTLIWIIIIVLILLLVFKCRKRKQQTTATSAEARYTSGAQVVKLSEDLQPPSSRPLTKPCLPPKKTVQNVSSPPVAPRKSAPNQSYGCTKASYDTNVYEAVNMQMSDAEEEYGGEYECI